MPEQLYAAIPINFSAKVYTIRDKKGVNFLNSFYIESHIHKTICVVFVAALFSLDSDSLLIHSTHFTILINNRAKLHLSFKEKRPANFAPCYKIFFRSKDDNGFSAVRT